jgi:aspartate racemase
LNDVRRWLHIAAAVAAHAVERGLRRLDLIGTRYLVESEVYLEKLEFHGLEYVRPNAAEREASNRIIFDELVYGVFTADAVAYFQPVVVSTKNAGCDAVVLGCTEKIPLIVSDSNSPLPTLDSTRLLARAALRRALGAPASANAAI